MFLGIYKNDDKIQNSTILFLFWQSFTNILVSIGIRLLIKIHFAPESGAVDEKEEEFV